MTWYLRSSLESDELGLRVSTPRTFLGFLPIDTNRFDRRLDEVRGVTFGAKLFPERLIVAIGLTLAAVFADLGTLGTVIVIAATLAMLPRSGAVSHLRTLMSRAVSISSVGRRRPAQWSFRLAQPI